MSDLKKDIQQKGVLLTSDIAGKRTLFFQKAAQLQNISFLLMDIHQPDVEKLTNQCIKIDPIACHTSQLNQLAAFYQDYKKCLMALEKVNGARFLNSPDVIITFLDKVATKKRLSQHGIKTPLLLGENVENIDHLHQIMYETGHQKVFVKPNYGSGASGVMAYEYDENKNQCRLYTSCRLDDGILYNTKKLRKLMSFKQIIPLMNQLLKQDNLVEVWLPKSRYQSYECDFRVVWQFGKMDYQIARLSKGPITNLHLNNSPLFMDELNLSLTIQDKIASLCTQVSHCFPKANMLALDILLDREATPWVIEINGQGDLLYKDIDGDNTIYNQQIINMDKWG